MTLLYLYCINSIHLPTLICETEAAILHSGEILQYIFARRDTLKHIFFEIMPLAW